MTSPLGQPGRFVALLVLLGASWGLTLPLSKIAVSTGYGHFGLIFWQLVIGALTMAVVSLARRTPLPLHRSAIKVYVVMAVVGTILPNSASYQALVHLPSGIASILLSLVPMLAFPMAIALRLERFAFRRLAGLGAGLVGVLLLTLPETSLPERAMLAWIPVALIAPFFYAFEGNYVARWGTAGVAPVQVLFGASLVGAIICLPLMVLSGQYLDPIVPWGAPEWALVASSVIHVFAYATYVWLVSRTGPVFASQVGYLVTGFGVSWAMLLLGETYSPYIWMALALVFAGVFLVQPRKREAVAP